MLERFLQVLLDNDPVHQPVISGQFIPAVPV